MITSLAIMFCGFAACMIGVASLLGYVLHFVLLYQWMPDSTPMALNTAMAICLTGCGLFLDGLREYRRSLL